jgi:chemotaxis protein methyltransferase CheR
LEVATESDEPFTGVADGRILAQAIVDTLREPLLVLDKDLRVVAASRSFYKTFNLQRQDVQGLQIYALAKGQWNIPELRLLLERILPQNTVMEAYEVEREFAGLGRRTMLLNARTVFHESKTGHLILLAIEDVTEAEAARRALEELLKQKEILLQEMQHRVANSLQIIASILLLKARTVQSDEIRLHLHDAHSRVMSVASVQKQLQATAHGESVAVAPYLTRLCASLAESMIGDSRPITLKVKAEAGDTTSSEAVSIGLIVTELVINALKHAFSQGEADGRVVVGYQAAGKAWRLSVSDSGGGKTPDIVAGSKPGLGTSIVEALASQLEARVETRSGKQGTQVSITHGLFPNRLTEAA